MHLVPMPRTRRSAGSPLWLTPTPIGAPAGALSGTLWKGLGSFQGRQLIKREISDPLKRVAVPDDHLVATSP